MKRIYCLFICSLICFQLRAQPLPDSIKKVFNAAKNDVEKGKILIRYFDLNTDEDTIYSHLIQLKQYFEEKKEVVIVDYISMGICRQLSRGAEYTDAINTLFHLLPKFESRKDDYGIMICNRHLSYAYYAARDREKTLYYDKITVSQSLALGIKYDLTIAYNNIAADMAEYELFDSAYIYSQYAVDLAQEINNPKLICKTLSTFGEGCIARKEYDKAIIYIKKALPIALIHSKQDIVYIFNDYAQIYLAKQQLDSVIYYATNAVRIASSIKLINQLLRSYEYLYAVYKQRGPLDSAYKYLKLTINTKDSIYGAEKIKQVQLINIRQENRQRELEQQKLELQNRIKIYSLIGGLTVFTFIGFFLYRNSLKEKRAKVMLQKKNELIEKTLTDLKFTQAQLIQSEKMASLGELTAGIAHEIQNPLNFVNNFSEINKELIAEMNEEINKGNYVAVITLANDITENEQKINHHGKRADSIVKGMLQHSKSNTGQKKLTNINALTDEYLRLSYHGIRAKDKSFNAVLKTDFDTSIGNININPQDIGRVLLNLITNAFYAVNEQVKRCQAEPIEAKLKYDPTVSVSTKKENGNVEIKVSDNGNGIPQNIIDKIFQPFFTTKPTGQGTGLGLSLAYDIVKAHGGELKVETKVNEGTSFIIYIPTHNQ